MDFYLEEPRAGVDQQDIQPKWDWKEPSEEIVLEVDRKKPRTILGLVGAILGCVWGILAGPHEWNLLWGIIVVKGAVWDIIVIVFGILCGGGFGTWLANIKDRRILVRGVIGMLLTGGIVAALSSTEGADPKEIVADTLLWTAIGGSLATSLQQHTGCAIVIGAVLGGSLPFIFHLEISSWPLLVRVVGVAAGVFLGGLLAGWLWEHV